jgi:hypothetical protein
VHHVRIAAIALCLLAGCDSSHEPITATSGVYALSIASEHDACSPTRATGPMGTAGVVATTNDLTIAVPDSSASTPMLVSLDGAAAYAEERSDTLAACPTATLARSYSIVSTSASGLDVAYTETWQGLASCTPAMRAMMPAAPTIDCRADLLLHYRLTTPCAAPCQLRVEADASTTCSC